MDYEIIIVKSERKPTFARPKLVVKNLTLKSLPCEKRNEELSKHHFTQTLEISLVNTGNHT